MTKPTLLRALGPWSSVSVVVGSVIGSGVFLVASDIARSVPDPLTGLSVWIVAGALTFLGGLVFSELGAMFPGAGGQYVYLKEAFGTKVGFLFSWTHILILAPGTVAALAVAFGQFSVGWLPPSEISQAPWIAPAIASVAIVALTWVNLGGVVGAARVLNWLTSFKVLVLLGLALAGVVSWLAGTAVPHASAIAPEGAVNATPALASYGVALIAAFWAYDGWSGLSQVAGEVRDPHRNIPWGYVAGLGIVASLYVLVNWAYTRVLSPEQIAASSFVAAEAAQAWGGTWARSFISLTVAVSTLGCLNATILTGARAAYAVAEDSVLPPLLKRIDPKTRVPSMALLLQGVLSLGLAWSGTYNQLFTYVVAAAFLFYAATALALLRLRSTRPTRERPYRVPLYPVLPLAYLSLCGLFIFNTFRETPVESLIGLGIAALGLPAYFAFRAYSRTP